MRGNFKEFICRKKKQMGRNLFLYFGWLYSKLPQNYKFIFISFGVSGNAALITFLSLCGLREIRLAQDNEVEYYKESKKKLKDSIGENYISIFFYNNKKRFNVARILSYKAPILIVLRDPISRFRSMMNYRFLLLNNKVLDLNLKNDLRTTLSEILYGDEARLTKKSQLTYVENLLLNGNFKFKSDLTPFLTNEGGGGGNPRQVIYIDMEEIKADKAFDTMKRLSQILHFNPPKEEDRVKFERKVADIYFSVPNFTIFVDDKDFPQLKEKIKIVVAKEQEKMANLTNAKNLFLNENDLCYKHLSINVEQKYYELIKEDKEIKEKLKNYFKEFVKVLDEKVRFRKQHALNENDV
ncbi:DUF2972 domain-containing protein, partial [Campylobacter upsaliensis]